MSGLEETEQLLRRALVALPEYRDDLLLIGGLVPWLYRRLDDIRVPPIRPSPPVRRTSPSSDRCLPRADR